jgi:dihydropteroate synthase
LIPRLRVVPPRPSQLAGDPESAFAVYFGEDLATVSLATAAAGLGLHMRDGTARVQGTTADLGALQAELERRGSPLGARLAAFLHPVTAWRLPSREVALREPVIMGIVNLTQDSFSGDGVGRDLEAALHRAEQLRSEGADIIDVGAESARADRPTLDAEAEAELVAKAVSRLAAEGHTVSSDTYKPAVAEAALAAGAQLVNDISGLTRGTGAAEAAARAGAGYVLNYSYGVPKVRPDTPPFYGDVVAETVAWMDDRLAQLHGLGLGRAQVAIDPGIAFGKSHDEDIQVLRRIGEFTTPGAPLLLAHSRKNFIGSITGVEPGARDLETHVTSALAWAGGVRIYRVHDVAGTRRALALARAIEGGAAGDFAPDGESWPWRAGSSATHMTTAAPDKPPPGGQRW